MRYTILFIAARIASDGSTPIPGVFGRVKTPFSQLSTLLVKCRNGSRIECWNSCDVTLLIVALACRLAARKMPAPIVACGMICR